MYSHHPLKSACNNAWDHTVKNEERIKYWSIAQYVSAGWLAASTGIAVDVVGAGMDHPDQLYMILLMSRMPIARDLVGSILLLWFSLGISRTEAKQREGWVLRLVWGSREKMKTYKCAGAVRKKKWEAEAERFRAQLTRVSLNVLGLLYLSISAGWNWLLFCSTPSGEASTVLVPSNWRVMSVTTSVSGKCVKYTKWSPFYSSCLHCFLPDGVPVPFSKAFDTLLCIGCFFN